VLTRKRPIFNDSKVIVNLVKQEINIHNHQYHVDDDDSYIDEQMK